MCEILYLRYGSYKNCDSGCAAPVRYSLTAEDACRSST